MILKKSVVYRACIGEHGSVKPQTRSQLKKIPAVPYLFQHQKNKSYYAVKWHGGKPVTKALKDKLGNPITDFATAKAELARWIASLDGQTLPVTNGFTISDLLDRRINPKQLRMAAENAQGLPTLAECFETFMALKQSNSEGTQEKYKYAKRALELHGGNTLLTTRITRITVNDLVAFFMKLKQAVAPQSFNTYAIVYNQVFEAAKLQGTLKENPMDKMPKDIRHTKVKSERQTIPTIEQCEAIVASIRSQKASDTAQESGDLAAFLHLAALGQAEAAFMTWRDIDFDNGVMHVKRIKTDKQAVVPIYPHLRPLLDSMAAKAANRKPTEKVFKVSNVKKAISGACKRLGYPDFSPRDFRKARIVWMLRKGVPVEYIAKCQLHSDNGVLIRKVYSFVIDEQTSTYDKAMLALMDDRTKVSVGTRPVEKK